MKVFFGCPSHDGRSYNEFFKSVRATEEEIGVTQALAVADDVEAGKAVDVRSGTVGFVGGPCFVEGQEHSPARDELAARFLRSEADVFLGADSDISWPAETALAIIRAAEKTGGMVAASYPYRALDLAAIRRAPEGTSGQDLLRWASTNHAVGLDLKGGMTSGRTLLGFKMGEKRFLKATWVGMGLFAITRRAMQQAVQDMKPYKRSGLDMDLPELYPMGVVGQSAWPWMDAEGKWCSEDVHFSLIIRSKHIPLHVLVDCPDVRHHIAPGIAALNGFARVVETGGFGFRWEGEDPAKPAGNAG
jgi:hypothetical protein